MCEYFKCKAMQLLLAVLLLAALQTQVESRSICPPSGCPKLGSVHNPLLPNGYYGQPYAYQAPYGYSYQAPPPVFSPPASYYDNIYGVYKAFPGGGVPVHIDYNNRCSRNYVGIKPHPDQQQYYYFCQPNCVIFGKCPNLEKFNATAGRCEDRVLPDYTPLCPKEGRYPYHYDCKIYYKCDANLIPRLYGCPTSTIFSPLERKCVPGDECPSTEISDSGSYIPENCELKFPQCSEDGTFRSPNDCSLYYTCKLQKNGKFLQTRYKCHGDSLYDIERKMCLPQSQVTCQNYVRVADLAYAPMPAFYPYPGQHRNNDYESDKNKPCEPDTAASNSYSTSTTPKEPKTSYPTYASYPPFSHTDEYNPEAPESRDQIKKETTPKKTTTTTQKPISNSPIKPLPLSHNVAIKTQKPPTIETKNTTVPKITTPILKTTTYKFATKPPKPETTIVTKPTTLKTVPTTVLTTKLTTTQPSTKWTPKPTKTESKTKWTPRPRPTKQTTTTTTKKTTTQTTTTSAPLTKPTPPTKPPQTPPPTTTTTTTTTTKTKIPPTKPTKPPATKPATTTVPPTKPTQPPPTKPCHPETTTVPPTKPTQPPPTKPCHPETTTVPPTKPTQPPPTKPCPPETTTVPPTKPTQPPPTKPCPPETTTVPPTMRTQPPPTKPRPPKTTTVPPTKPTQPPPTKPRPPKTTTVPPTKPTKPTLPPTNKPHPPKTTTTKPPKSTKAPPTSTTAVDVPCTDQEPPHRGTTSDTKTPPAPVHTQEPIQNNFVTPDRNLLVREKEMKLLQKQQEQDLIAHNLISNEISPDYMNDEGGNIEATTPKLTPKLAASKTSTMSTLAAAHIVQKLFKYISTTPATRAVNAATEFALPKLNKQERGEAAPALPRRVEPVVKKVDALDTLTNQLAANQKRSTALPDDDQKMQQDAPGEPNSSEYYDISEDYADDENEVSDSESLSTSQNTTKVDEYSNDNYPQVILRAIPDTEVEGPLETITNLPVLASDSTDASIQTDAKQNETSDSEYNYVDYDYANDDPALGDGNENPDTVKNLSVQKSLLTSLLREKLAKQKPTKKANFPGKLKLSAESKKAIDKVMSITSTTAPLSTTTARSTTTSSTAYSTTSSTTSTSTKKPAQQPLQAKSNSTSNSEYDGADDAYGDYDYVNDAEDAGETEYVGPVAGAAINQDGVKPTISMSTAQTKANVMQAISTATAKRHSIHPTSSSTSSSHLERRKPEAAVRAVFKEVSGFPAAARNTLAGHVDDKFLFKTAMPRQSGIASKALLKKPLDTDRPKLQHKSNTFVNANKLFKSAGTEHATGTSFTQMPHQTITVKQAHQSNSMPHIVRNNHMNTANTNTNTNPQAQLANSSQQILTVNRKPWLMEAQNHTLHIKPISLNITKLPSNPVTHRNRSLLAPTTIDYDVEKVPQLILKVNKPFDLKVVFCPTSCEEDHDHKFDPADNFKHNCTDPYGNCNHHLMTEPKNIVDLIWMPETRNDTIGFRTA